MGDESRSSISTWAVEFDGLDHFLASRAPTGVVISEAFIKKLLYNHSVNIK
jgi:hypothetical protein